MVNIASEAGRNLNVLICTYYQWVFHWMSFAAWYSVTKNLPEADVAVVSARCPVNLQLYVWAHKSGVKFFMHRDVGRKNHLPYLNKLYGTYVALQEGLVTQPLVVLDADMMAVRSLSEAGIRQLSACPFAFSSSPAGPVWYFNGQPLEIFREVINTVKRNFPTADAHQLQHLDLAALREVLGPPAEVADLGNETYQENATTFTHYRERCGNFYRRDYEKGVVRPPFAEGYALRTTDMSVNERKVYSLWGQMPIAFDALNRK